jgi:miniconductance mechanosensitive channel
MSSIRYLNTEDLKVLSKIERIKDYISNKSKDISDYNRENIIDKSLLINGRNLTNIGVFRKYVESYIEEHSAINKDLMIMTRQLEPNENGLPIEIYAFSNDKRWQNYEYIIADIFDHIIAASSSFDLEIYERKF